MKLQAYATAAFWLSDAAIAVELLAKLPTIANIAIQFIVVHIRNV